MKKIATFVILAIISLTAMAQQGTNKQLEKFTEVKAYDRIIVELVKGNENKLVITGDDKDEVKITNKDGLLKIRMEFDNFMDGGEAKATLYYTEMLTLLDANENAKIVSVETLKGGRIEVKVQEGAQIDLNVNVEDLLVKSVSGGEIRLSGDAKAQDVTVNTGGKVYNEKLNTENTSVSVSAGGRANVKASNHVKAKVKAGGSINIYGNPKDVEKDKLFGGNIKVMD